MVRNEILHTQKLQLETTRTRFNMVLTHLMTNKHADTTIITYWTEMKEHMTEQQSIKNVRHFNLDIANI
jgi:hypothetical protein